MLCPRCGAEALASQGFCTKCGAAFAAAGSAESSAAPNSGPAAPAASQPPSAAPRPIPESGLTVEELGSWLENEGYAVKFVTGESGRRHIETNCQGSPLNIFLGDCKGERCASLELAAGFSTGGKFDVTQINGWNYDNRWCRAYYDNVNDPWLRMNIDLWPGGTYEALSSRFETWNRTLGRFIDKFGLR
ncbi:MAG TPA: YbjN domain-containing protein [Terracidiphilus sp.]